MRKKNKQPRHWEAGLALGGELCYSPVRMSTSDQGCLRTSRLEQNKPPSQFCLSTNKNRTFGPPAKYRTLPLWAEWLLLLRQLPLSSHQCPLPLDEIYQDAQAQGCATSWHYPVQSKPFLLPQTLPQIIQPKRKSENRFLLTPSHWATPGFPWCAFSMLRGAATQID